MTRAEQCAAFKLNSLSISTEGARKSASIFGVLANYL
jgi:hypothetical protein